MNLIANTLHEAKVFQNIADALLTHLEINLTYDASKNYKMRHLTERVRTSTAHTSVTDTP